MADFNQQTDSTVAGYFSSEQPAEAAIRALHAAGFTHEQIGVAGRPASGTRESGAYVEGRRAGEAAAGFWQHVRNFFEGGSSEESARGRQSVRTAGDNQYDYDYDYDSGDFHRSLGQLSFPNDRSRYFSSRLAGDSQGILVTVNAGARLAEAESILESNGADLGRNSDALNESESSNGLDGVQRMQLYGEVLRVHRDRIQRGEVRLRKETVTDTQTVEVPVAREELVVERVPVAGEQAAPGARIGQDSEIRIPLAEDRVSVEKEPVVREEVQAGKREVVNVEAREEQTRHEELRVDDQTRKKAS